MRTGRATSPYHKGRLFYLAPLCRGTLSAAPLVQRGEVEGGLSARFPICLKTPSSNPCLYLSRTSYPLRHSVPPPLTIKGGMRTGRATSPYHKGRLFLLSPLVQGNPSRQPPLCKGGKWKGGLSSRFPICLKTPPGTNRMPTRRTGGWASLFQTDKPLPKEKLRFPPLLRRRNRR